MARWQADEVRKLYKRGYVVNAFGRRRRFPNLRHANFSAKNRAERQAGNFCIQGTAADMFKFALVKVANVLEGTGVKIVNVVHDEIQFYWPKNELHLLSEVKETMESFNFGIPIVADVAYTETNWGDKKELKL